MSRRTRSIPAHALRFLLCLAAALVLAKDTPQKPTLKTVGGYSEREVLALGERMYREGISPSGEPLRSVVSGDIPVAGTVFTCVSCHVRSGVGSYEGGVVTLPTNGAKLAQSRYWKFPNLLPEERANLRVKNPEARPPYTDSTLADALRVGVDPSGREFNHVMPRYDLNDQDMAILTHYLWSLSASLPSGVDAENIRLGTVITEEVSLEDQEAMLVPMNNYIAHHNTFPAGFGNRMYMSVGGKEMSGSFRKLSLSIWRLKGAPETWARQLEAYQTKEPVFALLGGISHREWTPIHAFCESHKLPCLMPITDLPVVSATDWYTQYASKGYYQEGQAVARYLHSLDDAAPSARMLQVIQYGPEGRDLATGFRETWQELGQGAVKEINLGKGETLRSGSLRALIQKEQPSAVLVWAGADAFDALESLVDLPGRPAMVFLSSRLLGTRLTSLPEKIRAFTSVTYPYREPKDELAVSRYANSLMKGISKHKPETRIATRTYSMLQIFEAVLVDMDRNVYRDNFLDRVGMLHDFLLPDFLRFSFGPGQRYASKGCFIMQVTPGPDPKLLRKSDWVIH